MTKTASAPATHPFTELSWRAQAALLVGVWSFVVEFGGEHCKTALRFWFSSGSQPVWWFTAPVMIIALVVFVGGVWRSYQPLNRLLETAPARSVLPTLAIFLIAWVLGMLLGDMAFTAVGYAPFVGA